MILYWDTFFFTMERRKIEKVVNNVVKEPEKRENTLSVD